MAQETSLTRKPGFLFWLLWLLASAAAWAVFWCLNFDWGSVDQMRALWTIGILEGLLQWLVIRRWIQHGWRWGLATAFSGCMAGLFILLGGSLGLTLIFFFIGGALVQWFALSDSVQRAALWLVIKIAAVLVTAAFSLLPLFGLLLDSSGGIAAWAIFGAFSGVVYGAVSGFGLMRLLRRPLAGEEAAKCPLGIVPMIRIVAVVVFLLLVAPPYALWQVYSLQKRIYCEAVQVGMTHEEVNRQLAAIRSIDESSASFGASNPDTGLAEVLPYPESLREYAEGVVDFVSVDLHDLTVDVPQPGLGFDEEDVLRLISSDTRSYQLNYSRVECPWTFEQTWRTLFD